MAESGTNVLLGRVAGKHKNPNPGTALEGRYVSRSTVGQLPGVKEYATEPTAAAEGDACRGKHSGRWGGPH